MKSIGKVEALAIVISLVQILDIILHVATDQAEPIRIAANIIILGWLALSVSGKFAEWSRQLSLAAVAAYCGLNLSFLSQAGLVNSESGEFRTPLFILVVLTISVSTMMAVVNQRENRNDT